MSNTTLYLVQGDTKPAVRFPVQYSNSSFMDLTGSTVYFIFSKFGSDEYIFKRLCTIEDPATSGYCYYNWQVGDLTDAGNYLGSLEIVAPDGKIQSLQNLMSFFVRPQLDPSS